MLPSRNQLRLLRPMVVGRVRRVILGDRPDPALFDISTQTPVRTFYPGKLFDPLGIRWGLDPQEGIPACGLNPQRSDLSPVIRPGAVYELTVDDSGSYFGDCIRVVDAAGEKPVMEELPCFGWSGALLLGGYAMTHSPLSGPLTLKVGEVADGFAEVSLSLPTGLQGVDGLLTSPDGYRLSVRQNRVVADAQESRGLLEVSTGRLYDFHFCVRFSNSAIDALLAENPSLEAPPLLFPGLPYAGHCIGQVLRDPETSSMECSIAAQVFLPLGEGSDDRPLTLPPSESPEPELTAITARNSSLHPFLLIRATNRPPGVEDELRPSSTAAQRPETPLSIYENLEVELTALPARSAFGDVFTLNSPDLQGQATGRSPLFGGVRIQFGPINGRRMPFVLSLSPPSRRFESRFRDVLQLLPPGTVPGMVGLDGWLRYGKRTYQQSRLCFMSDAQKLSIGVVDIDTGAILGPFIMRNYLFLSLFEDLVIAEPRTPTDSFGYCCSGRFSAENGRLSVSLRGEVHVPYPEGYRFPLPGGGSTTVSAGSYLQPFIEIRACQIDEGQVPTEAVSKYRSQSVHRDHAIEPRTVELEGGPGETLQLSLDGERTGLRVLSTKVVHDSLGSETIVEAETDVARAPEAVVLSLAAGLEGRALLLASESGGYDSHTTEVRSVESPGAPNGSPTNG